MADRFHVNCSLGVGPVKLDGPEAHHLARVCRLRPGNVVCLFNGDGREYPATVIQVTKRAVSLEVLRVEAPERELGFRLEVAAPLPKGDRTQFLIEKLTELGVTTFVPLTTARSVGEPREAKREKLDRYVIEASKQCGRNVLMQIESPAEWAAYCRRDTLPSLRLLAHPGGANRLGMVDRGDAALAIGPEGGFTDEEVELGRAAGWQVVGLGPRILRVETAAIALTVLRGRSL
jgi:16S rRNA (uracil1498-N3)-methyltransferase